MYVIRTDRKAFAIQNIPPESYCKDVSISSDNRYDCYDPIIPHNCSYNDCYCTVHIVKPVKATTRIKRPPVQEDH